jgi:hypothetical protein
MEAQTKAVSNAIARINARAWGISTGMLLGVILFMATNLLVVRGGPNVGQHLQLLSIYFPGYSVTFLGSLVGFVYAFVVGYGLGRVIGFIYTRVAGVGG